MTEIVGATAEDGSLRILEDLHPGTTPRRFGQEKWMVHVRNARAARVAGPDPELLLDSLTLRV